MIARTSQAQLPIFIPLVRVREPTARALINECRFILSNLGYDMSGQEFLDRLHLGGFRLLLDGLDEAGSAAPKMYSVIQKLARKYKRCSLIVSCRDTLTLKPWSSAVHFQLNSFTDDQLRAFVERWFRAEPSARDKLTAWLAENPRMMMASRTPLIAALLCALQHADAEMPTTEVALYEDRFAMLLGKWEGAKGIERLSPKLRQRYWHLLMNLAVSMHRQELRMIKLAEALEQARQLASNEVTAGAMVMDCAYRGILIWESTGDLSFGHLTYQEFLAARWLSRENPITFILNVLTLPWWAKTLDFYAAIHEDISELVKEAIASEAKFAYGSLSRLASIAPLTHPGVLRELRGKIDPGRSRIH